MKTHDFKYHTRPEEDVYADGFATGAVWDRDWTPGGPFVHSAGHSQKPDWIDFCNRSAANAKAWLRGWHDGVIATADTTEISGLKTTSSKLPKIGNVIQRRKS